jgi:hypothetical protein
MSFTLHLPHGTALEPNPMNRAARLSQVDYGPNYAVKLGAGRNGPPRPCSLWWFPQSTQTLLTNGAIVKNVGASPIHHP